MNLQLLDEKLDSIGYRMLRMLQAAPAMLEPVSASSLQARFSDLPVPISRAELMVHAWRYIDRLAHDPHHPQAFPGAYTEQTQAAIEHLLLLRTHPEMQVFFRYFSPSGYINEGRSTQTEVS